MLGALTEYLIFFGALNITDTKNNLKTVQVNHENIISFVVKVITYQDNTLCSFSCSPIVSRSSAMGPSPLSVSSKSFRICNSVLTAESNSFAKTKALSSLQNKKVATEVRCAIGLETFWWLSFQRESQNA